MPELFLDMPRSELRRRLDVYRLSDLEHFLARKRLTFPVREKARIIEMLVMKPGLVSELMEVLYLREGISKKRLIKLAGDVGVATKRTDTREALALKIRLRKPDVLERAHALAKARNVRKWKIFLRKDSARFERKPLDKLGNALTSQLRRKFTTDVALGGLFVEDEKIIAIVRHAGRGAFREETTKIRYGLSTSEIVIEWDWKKLKINSVSEGSLLVVKAFGKSLGCEEGFYPEDAVGEVRKMLEEAQTDGRFPGGQIVRLKISGVNVMGLKSVDARGSRLEKLFPLLPKVPVEKIEIVEWLSGGKRDGFDFRSGRWISR